MVLNLRDTPFVLLFHVGSLDLVCIPKTAATDGFIPVPTCLHAFTCISLLWNLLYTQCFRKIKGYMHEISSNINAVKYFSPATSTAIIRCPRSSYRLVWSALTYITRLPAPKPGKPYYTKDGSLRHPPKSAPAAGGETQRECVIRVVRVSGTMKKAEQEAIRRARMEVLRVMRRGEEKGTEMLEGMFGGEVGRGIESEDEDEDEEEESEG